MLRVGIIGYRGMVGSVLLERMRAEGDLEGLNATLLSTSRAGTLAPDLGQDDDRVGDATSLEALERFDVLMSCQGGAYTKGTYPALRARGWAGYWIDAASVLRMNDDAVLALDPVNRAVIDRGLRDGLRTYCGANCTVSLMLMGLGGLLASGSVEWMTTMSYQAASGAGAANMRELVEQMAALGRAASGQLADPSSSALELDRAVREAVSSDGFPTEVFGHPLAASLLPWIDSAVEAGQTREEWKAQAEGNKILGRAEPIPIDGLCVRVGSMRCHAQAVTIALRGDIPLDEISEQIASANEWTHVVPNDRDSTLRELTPAAVGGSLTVPVGRLRKLSMGGRFLTAFTVGDQLLWGAAEPLRRMLVILREHLSR